MGIKGRLAIGGCGGSAIGMLLGAVAGFWTARGLYPLPNWQPIELFTGLLFVIGHAATFVIWVLGAVIGGAIGSMVGAAVGSAMAARSEQGRSTKSPSPEL
jgi:hypothetical protein